MISESKCGSYKLIPVGQCLFIEAQFQNSPLKEVPYTCENIKQFWGSTPEIFALCSEILLICNYDGTIVTRINLLLMTNVYLYSGSQPVHLVGTN